MQALRSTIERVAFTDFTVLLEGESGVGKELVARQIHDLSRRRHGPSLGEIEEIALGGPDERDERDDADRRDEDDDRDQRARGTQRGTVRRYSRYDAPKRSSSVGSS